MSEATVTAEVLMPSLAEGMESGTIVAWFATSGDPVTAGDELFEVETEKATMTVEAEASGTLEILAHVGATVAVGEVIARIGDGAPAPSPEAPSPDTLSPAANGVSQGPADTVADSPWPKGAGHRASPLARRIAQAHDVDLSGVDGTGPGGRITRSDVARAAGLPATTNGTPAAPLVQTSPSAATATESTGDDAPGRGQVKLEQLTRTQAVIARRMSDAKAGAPDFIIGVDVDMEETVALRARLKTLAGDDKPPSYNDFIVKASALALREFPRANGAFAEDHFELFENINVGVAVAADDALIVPTIFHADRKSLGEIGRESRRLAAKAREGKITPAELSGGTFTVSNLGMFGISEFISILNPPQAAILSAGEMKRTPVEHGGEIVLRHMLKLRLTCDHRILYGADAAGFLQRIKQLLEAPLAMSL
jgi:pyruvate dehydrogenase E2 component (dihydrolipoamide acetyltransferase)